MALILPCFQHRQKDSETLLPSLQGDQCTTCLRGFLLKWILKRQQVEREELCVTAVSLHMRLVAPCMWKVLRQGAEKQIKSSTDKHQVGKEMTLQWPIQKDVLSLVPTADTNCSDYIECKVFLCCICAVLLNWLAGLPRNLCCILVYAGSQKPELTLEWTLIKLKAG